MARNTRGGRHADVWSGRPIAPMHASMTGRDRLGADATGALAIREANRWANDGAAPAIAARIVTWTIRAVLLPAPSSLHRLQQR